MELDILVRGQSNAFLLMSEDLGGVGRTTLQSEVQRLLGFDGVNDQVHLIFDWWTPGAETIHSTTSFVGDWMTRSGNGWQALGPEEALLNNVRQFPHGADATAVLWLHSENDSRNASLTAEEWMSAVRAEAELLRGVLGTDPAHSPYMFVSAIPYASGTDSGHQAIRLGMEGLAADPDFNAAIAARALDLDMDYKFPTDSPTPTFGGAHMSEEDAAAIAHRVARAIAEEWADYARPGSPVALAGGDIADDGPQVVGTTLSAPDTLRVTVTHDGAAGLAPLDPDAATGLGWTVRSGNTVVEADSARIIDANTLELHFGASLPAGGMLHYGFGYGRLASHDQPGQGNAVYDEAGLPIWTPAAGVAIGGTVTPPPPPPEPPAPAPSGPVDWDALAAAMNAYHQATGQWWGGDPADLLNQAPPPPELPAPSGAVDWDALAAAMNAYHEATGQWWGGDPAELLNQTPEPAPPETPAPSGPVDWDALAAQVTANLAATGNWFG